MGGSKRLVCVTGASGYVASWLVKRLLSSGYYVRGTVRDPECAVIWTIKLPLNGQEALKAHVIPALFNYEKRLENYLILKTISYFLHVGFSCCLLKLFTGNYKKLEHLWQLEGAKERLQLVKADLMKEGSFDEAVMGCEGVFHTASPVIGQADPKACSTEFNYLFMCVDKFIIGTKFYFLGMACPLTELFKGIKMSAYSKRSDRSDKREVEILDPAIKGTLNILSSCKKNPYLKRVVLTSSSSAVRAREIFDGQNLLDESSWSCVDLCKRLKIWYALSKTLAEKSAWEFAAANEIDLVTVIPSFIIGPSLPQDLSTTASDVLGLLKGIVQNSYQFIFSESCALAVCVLCSSPSLYLFIWLGTFMRVVSHWQTGDSDKFSAHGRMGYVHIDDVARCHILVFEDPAAKGRYLCSSTVLENHELASLLEKRYPFLPIPKRFQNKWGTRPYYDFNTGKLRSLGFEFKGIEEMFDDCIASLKEQGHLL
ncbi:hypothetical protein ACLOJK_036615 [Asimina triloba]